MEWCSYPTHEYSNTEEKINDRTYIKIGKDINLEQNINFHIPWTLLKEFYIRNEKIPEKYIHLANRYISTVKSKNENFELFIFNPITLKSSMPSNNKETCKNNKLLRGESIEIKGRKFVFTYLKGEKNSLMRVLKWFSRDTENSRPYKSGEQRMDTKFTYYFIVLFTKMINELPRVIKLSNINDYVLLYDLSPLKNNGYNDINDKGSKQEEKNIILDSTFLLNCLRANLIKICENVNIVDLKDFYFGKNGCKNNRKGLLLEYYCKRAIKLTKNKTKFVEKWLDLNSRAFNSFKGENLNFVLRNVVNPYSRPIIRSDALLFLGIHELAHSFSPISPITQDIYYSGVRLHIQGDKNNSHGIEFQKVMVYLFNLAKKIGILPNYISSNDIDTYSKCEMMLRENFQDSYLLVHSNCSDS